MRILADENLESAIIARLRTDGHDVTAVIEDAPSTKDPAVPQTAIRENRLLLTADHDFGDLIFRNRLPAPAAGVVLYRISDEVPDTEKARIISESLVSRAPADFAGHFTVVNERGTRPPRPLP